MNETTSQVSGVAEESSTLGPIPSIVAGSPRRNIGAIVGFLGLMTFIGLLVCRNPRPKARVSANGGDLAVASPAPQAISKSGFPFEGLVTQPVESRGAGESLLEIRRRSPMVILNKQGAGLPVAGDSVSGGPGAARDAGVPLPRGFRPTWAQSAEAMLMGDRDNLIAQGKLIDAVLETAIDSDHPGMLRALVSHDVYGETGGNVLLPRGSRLIGQYDSAVAKGQNRVFVLWQRVIRPDGVDVQLESAGTDPLGGTGIEGSVNYHFWAMFGAATLLSVIGGAASTVGVNQADQNNSLSQYRENVTNGLNTAAGTVLQQFTQIKPTIKVRQGIAIKVFVARDVHFDPALLGGQELQAIP